MTKSKGFLYDFENGKEKVEDMDEFVAEYGERFLVTGLAGMMFKGSFRMKTWVIPAVPIINHTPTAVGDDLAKFKKIVAKKDSQPDPGKFKDPAKAKSASIKNTTEHLFKNWRLLETLIK